MLGLNHNHRPINLQFPKLQFSLWCVCNKMLHCVFDTFQDIVEKFIYLGDDRNITQVYIGGERIL